MKIYNYLKETFDKKGAAYLILIDPDKLKLNNAEKFLQKCEESGVDGFLVGGSLMLMGDFENYILELKKISKLPLIIFPGALSQISPNADALLYISVVSGRNPEYLFGNHVIAAPLIKKYQLETLSTGYMIIESGKRTTAEYMSGSQPIPRNKTEIAIATALAAQYMGMKFVYLEAGSGAESSVPYEMVKGVSDYCDVDIIVGGGIRTPEAASKMVKSGAKIIVTGNHFEDENNWAVLKQFADAVHYKKSIVV